MKVKEYKGYIFEYSSPQIGFFSTGRGGKVTRKIFVTHPLTPGFGKWCNSEAEAKRYVNESKK